jgi:hypothetical protein
MPSQLSLMEREKISQMRFAGASGHPCKGLQNMNHQRFDWPGV